MHLTALDDAAWAGPWRMVRVGEKVFLAVSLVLSALLAPVWPGTPLVAVAAVILIIGPARIPPPVLGVAMAAPLAFIALGSLSVAVNVGGSTLPDALWAWGPLSVSQTSTIRALEVFGHGVAGTLALMVLATTTPMIDLLTWLRKLRVPDPLIEVASLTYRLLFVLLDTLLNVHEAQTNRLADAADFRRRWHNMAGSIGAVLVRSWDRAARLQSGLEARGYESKLVTLPIARSRSVSFMIMTVMVLIAVWGVALVVAR